MGRITETVKVLLIANILFFLGSQFLGDFAIKTLALWFPENENFGIWQVVTHMFMHGDISHIFFNMFGLWMFGTPLEQNSHLRMAGSSLHIKQKGKWGRENNY